MSVILSERVRSMKASASIAAKNKVGELQAAGHQIVDFTVGEPDLDTPAHVVDAAVRAMRDGQTHYTATLGTPDLRAAIAAKLQRENGLDYQPQHIVVGCGAKQVIYAAFEATVDNGDEVIVPAPFWVSYPDIAGLFGGTPIVVKTRPEDGFKLTPADLEAAITLRTRWLVLNSPNNPSGAVYTRQEMRALSDVLLRHPHVMIMSDDIYEHIIFDGVEFCNIAQCEPQLQERTLLINGLSKSFAMTGWRVGYGAGPAILINAIGKLLGQSTTCASSISQSAAVAALEGDHQFLKEALTEYTARRNLMVRLLSEVEGFEVRSPDGAFYVYPSVAGLLGLQTPSGARLETDLDVSLYLLEEAKVAVLDGAAYGLSPYLRLSFATSMTAIEAGCRQIKDAVVKLRKASSKAS